MTYRLVILRVNVSFFFSFGLHHIAFPHCTQIWVNWQNLVIVDVMSIVEGPGLDRMWKAITSPWTVADTARRSKVKRIIHWDKDRHFPLHSPIQKQKTKNIQKPIPIKIYLKTFPTQYARVQNCHDNTILNTLSGVCLF